MKFNLIEHLILEERRAQLEPCSGADSCGCRLCWILQPCAWVACLADVPTHPAGFSSSHEFHASKIVALSRARVCFQHVFLTEKDPLVAAAGHRVSEAMGYPVENLLPDMRARPSFKEPGLDLYVCSTPCQSFSASGQRKAGSRCLTSRMIVIVVVPVHAPATGTRRPARNFAASGGPSRYGRSPQGQSVDHEIAAASA